MKRILFLIPLILLTVSCTKQAIRPSLADRNCPAPESVKPVETKPAESKPSDLDKIPDYGLLKSAKWQSVDGFAEDDLTAAWPAWLQSCTTLINKTQWQTACNAAKTTEVSNTSIAAYFTRNFDVYLATNADGSNSGLITGYYQPMLKGSRKPSAQFAYPIYKPPADLVDVELGDTYPELKYKRLRGKLVGNKLVSYSTRADIDSNPAPLAGNELVWLDDPIDLFFLQVQGSGLIELTDGEKIQVGYADQNGHPYNSIGKILVQRGELSADQAGMQGIKTWAKNNPNKLRELLNSNPSYVFFKEMPKGLSGPLGALGVPISGERSVAIDPKFIPLGAPVFLATTQPNSKLPLKRLMLAQDTGGAIKGGVRADFYWGAGETAGAKAGAMRQQGTIWVLLPKGYKLN